MTTQLNSQIARQHIAEMQAAAANRRFARSARSASSARRGLLELLARPSAKVQPAVETAEWLRAAAAAPGRLPA